MDRNSTSTPNTSTLPESPSKPQKWKINFKHLGIVIASIIFAIGIVASALFKSTPGDRALALSTFWGWPLPLEVVAVLGALVIFAAIALWYPIRLAIQNRRQQDNITQGVKVAILETTTDDVPAIRGAVEDDMPAIRKLLTEIFNLLSSIFTPPFTRSRSTGLIVESDPVLLPPPYKPILVAPKPQDDVQLTPPDILIGRAAELNELEMQLTSHRRDRDTTVIIGIQGIGKTALAAKAIERIKNANAHAARQAEITPDIAATNGTTTGHFTGGIAYVYCVGKHDAVEVVRLTLERVDPNRRLPATLSLEILRQISEELLADKDILIMLDGVEPDVPLGEVVRALRTERRSAHILITTTAVPSINVAPKESHLYLKALGEVQHEDGTVTDAALELFAHYAGKQSAAEFGEDLEAAADIVKSLERHTYALQLVGAYVQVQSDILPQLAMRIEHLSEGIVPHEIEGILKEVWVATETAVESLPDETRQLLIAFSAFNTTEAGRDATHSLGETLGLDDVDKAIHTLVQRQLMESFHTPTMPNDSDCHRLRIHTLLHVYIAQIAATPEWTEHCTRGKDAIASHFARYIQQYDRHDPSRSTQRVLSPDANNIVHALDWAISRNQHEQVISLVHGMRRFWHDRWLTNQSLFYMPTAVLSAQLLASQARDAKNAAQEKAYLERAADIAFTLGRVYRRVGRLTEAEPLFQHDLKIRQKRHQYALEAEAFHQLAQLERSRGSMRQALSYCRQGLKVVRRHAPRRRNTPLQEINEFIQAKGLLLAQQGRIERSLGNLRRADRLFDQAYTCFEQTGDVLEQGVALGYRGRIARVLGDLPEAQKLFARSGQLAQQVYDFRGEGIISTQQGRIDRTRGDLDSAERLFQDGLNKALQVLDYQAVSVNRNYLGRIAAARGNALEAEAYFTSALEEAKRINDRLDEGVTLGYLGRIASERGYLQQARTNFRESLSILRVVKDRRGQGLILAQVALLDIKSRRFAQAKWRLWRSLRLIRRVGDKRSEGTIMMYQGQLHIERRDVAAARAQLSRALERFRLVQDRDGEAEVQLWLGKAAQKCGEIEQAKQCYEVCRAMVAEGGNKRLWTEADSNYNALNT